MLLCKLTSNVIRAGDDGSELEVARGAEQQQVLKCEGRPSEKQNLVSSKESTPAKDTGTTVTRPRSQFNTEQSIESENVSPPHVSVPALMGQKDNGKTVAYRDGGFDVWHKTIPVYLVSPQVGGGSGCDGMEIWD